MVPWTCSTRQTTASSQGQCPASPCPILHPIVLSCIPLSHPASPCPGPTATGDGDQEPLEGRPPPLPSSPQPHSANPSPTPPGSSLGGPTLPKPLQVKPDVRPHRRQHSRELGAGSSRRERRKARQGYLGVPAPGESSPLSGRAGPAEEPPGRCCGGWQGVGRAGLTSEAATSRLGLPARRRKRLLIPHTHTHTRGAALPSAVPHQRRRLSLAAPRGDTGAGGAPLTPLAPLAPRLPDKRLLFRARAPTAPPEARAQPPAFQPQETSLLPADPSLNITALRNQCKSHPCVLELFAELGQACPHGPASWRAPRPER